MINRRAFVKLGMVGLPLAGCAPGGSPPETDPVGSILRQTKTKLPPEVMADARKYAAGLKQAQQIVLDHNVSYDVEPRFFPSMT